jgi:four helix bundle protein
MRVKSFEDLEIWREAHTLALQIYELTTKFPKDEKLGLTLQMRRAAISVPANIAEGMGRNSTKELIKFVYNARGSLYEVLYYLTLSKDLGYIKLKEYKELHDRYDGLAKALNVFISKLKAKIT